MFGWFFGKKSVKKLEEDVKSSFESVKNDIEDVGKWIKHLHGSHEDVSEVISELKRDLSTIKEDIEGMKEAISFMDFEAENKQLSKKQTAVQENGTVYAVQTPVQTPVQTANFYEILHGLSSNERLLVFTLMNAAEDMKLSYEDLARLLGKERSTIRGQINSIKQKSEGLLQEMRESNGKKRVYISDELKDKLARYVKVKAGKERKKAKNKVKTVKVRVSKKAN